ncbi:hypothetical protein [Vampirovibrio sp.]|uniref:hypothetical protein n=1 Tax=Vampirovibrio sp. TaxID=2717857 RepID=UPI003593E02D
MAGSGRSYHEESWFELLFVALCFFVGFVLFKGLMPPVEMGPEAIQTVAMAKLFSEGRILDAFSRFNLPPVYPLLMALVIKLKHTTELPRLIEGFQTLNLILSFISTGLVYFFVRRQIPKPYTFIITALYVVAPPTLGMAWSISPQMVYMTLSLASLIAVDISLSKESVMGGELSRGEVILCGICIGLSILSWQVGYMLLIAFFFVTVKRFGLKRGGLVLSMIMLCLSPFIGRDLFYVARSPQPYFGPSASILQSMTRQGFFRTVETYADRIIVNVTDHALGDLNLASVDRLARTPRASGPSRIEVEQKPWVRWVIAGVAIVGAIYGLYQYTGVGTLYLCTYVITALALVPSAEMTLAPVLPLLLFYLYFGLLRMGQWFQRLDMPLLTKLAVPVLTAWILLATITSHLSLFRSGGNHPFKRHTPKIMYMSTAKEPVTRLETAQSTSAHRRAMDWLQVHTDPGDKVATPRPGALNRLTGGGQSQKPDAASEQQLQSELGQYNFLVEEGAAKISPAQTNQAKGLKMVYEDVPGRIRIWQVKPTL